MRVSYYVLNWDVVGKIAHAKLKGTWDDDVAVDDHNDLFSRVNRHTSLLDAYRLARHVAATPQLSHSLAQRLWRIVWPASLFLMIVKLTYHTTNNSTKYNITNKTY